MIVKNEEHNLVRCLASVRDVVDEIVVVDTGSTDGTRALARRLGARVDRFDFTDVHFSRARNRSLGLASGEWILVLDADETLDATSGAKLRRLIDVGRPRDAAYIVSRTNVRADRAPATDYAARLFPNSSRVRFTGRVHETVDESVLAAHLRLRTCDVVITHHLAPTEVLRAKSERYIGILRAELARNPHDATALAFLATECHKLGELDEAMRITELLVRLRPNDVHHQLNAGLYRYMCGDASRAREHVEHALALKPGYAAAQTALAWMTDEPSSVAA